MRPDGPAAVKQVSIYANNQFACHLTFVWQSWQSSFSCLLSRCPLPNTFFSASTPSWLLCTAQLISQMPLDASTMMSAGKKSQLELQGASISELASIPELAQLCIHRGHQALPQNAGAVTMLAHDIISFKAECCQSAGPGTDPNYSDILNGIRNPFISPI